MFGVQAQVAILVPYIPSWRGTLTSFHQVFGSIGVEGGEGAVLDPSKNVPQKLARRPGKCPPKWSRRRFILKSHGPTYQKVTSQSGPWFPKNGSPGRPRGPHNGTRKSQHPPPNTHPKTPPKTHPSQPKCLAPPPGPERKIQKCNPGPERKIQKHNPGPEQKNQKGNFGPDTMT